MTGPAPGLSEAFRSSGRTIASLFLHAGCNLECRFCVSAPRFDCMTRADAEALLEGLRAAGIRNVVFGGGEPTTWPHDMGRLAAYARDRGHFVQVSTNGVALPDGFAADARVDRWLLPLDAAEAPAHDALRRTPGHHALVHARLRELAGSGREVTVTTVVTRESAAGIGRLGESLARLAQGGLAIRAWHLYCFVAAGRGGAPHAADLAVGGAAWIGAVHAARGGARGFPVYVRPDVRRSRSVEYLWLERGRLRIGSQDRSPVSARV
jgi:MoaA/NifB/PqqE/SkfB family radical SAM enzyme